MYVKVNVIHLILNQHIEKINLFEVVHPQKLDFWLNYSNKNKFSVMERMEEIWMRSGVFVELRCVILGASVKMAPLGKVQAGVLGWSVMTNLTTLIRWSDPLSQLFFKFQCVCIDQGKENDNKCCTSLNYYSDHYDDWPESIMCFWYWGVSLTDHGFHVGSWVFYRWS